MSTVSSRHVDILDRSRDRTVSSGHGDIQDRGAVSSTAGHICRAVGQGLRTHAHAACMHGWACKLLYCYCYAKTKFDPARRWHPSLVRERHPVLRNCPTHRAQHLPGPFNGHAVGSVYWDHHPAKSQPTTRPALRALGPGLATAITVIAMQNIVTYLAENLTLLVCVAVALLFAVLCLV